MENLVSCVAWCNERNSRAGERSVSYLTLANLLLRRYASTGDGNCKGAFWKAQDDGTEKGSGVCTLYSTGMRWVASGGNGTRQSVAMWAKCPEDESFNGKER